MVAMVEVKDGMRRPGGAKPPALRVAAVCAALFLAACSSGHVASKAKRTAPAAGESAPQQATATPDEPPINGAVPVPQVAAEPLNSLEQPPDPNFSVWLDGVRSEALAKGIKVATLDAALTGIKPIPRVIELDRNQPEFKLTYKQYMDRVVPPSRIEKGRKMLAENRVLLSQVERQYGVQARFIVAFWGVETDFGRVTGGFQVIPALATLAHDGRRSSYFRRELMNALKIVDEGNVTPAKMVGSWAGAMGQCQFMPSSFVRFAVDGDGDGRKDLWNNKADVFASAANYLHQSGWNPNQTWGRAATLPKGFDRRLAGGDQKRSLKTWTVLGVRDANGKPLPKEDTMAALILPEADDEPAFLAYDNFFTTLKWNRSTFYALAVGQLADALATR